MILLIRSGPERSQSAPNYIVLLIRQGGYMNGLLLLCKRFERVINALEPFKRMHASVLRMLYERFCDIIKVLYRYHMSALWVLYECFERAV